MSLYGYDSGHADQQGRRPGYPAIGSGKRSSKLFDLSMDDFDDLDNMSDLEDLDFGKPRAPIRGTSQGGNTSFHVVSSSSQSPPGDAAHASRRGARSLSFDEHTYEASEGLSSQSPGLREYREPLKQHTPSVALDKRASVEVERETPAYRPPPAPKTQGSTVTTRWKRRGRLGLAKPKRFDAVSDDSASIDASPPAQLDFLGQNASTFGSIESLDSGTQRHSLASLDDADVEHTFQASRLRGARQETVRSAMVASQETVRSVAASQDTIRSVDTSDVSMGAEPSIDAGRETKDPGEPRRAMSPLARRPVSEDAHGSPKPQQRHESPRPKHDARLSALGDSAMDISTRFQQYERRIHDMSPQFKSPRERQRALAEQSPEPAELRDEKQARGYGSASVRADWRSPSEQQQQSRVERHYSSPRLSARRAGASESNFDTLRAESKADTQRAEGSINSVRAEGGLNSVQAEGSFNALRTESKFDAVRTESKFDALRTATPPHDAMRVEPHSGPRVSGSSREERSPFAVPAAEEKERGQAVLREQYVVAAAQVAQSSPLADVQPKATPSPQENPVSAPASQPHSQQQHQQQHHSLSAPASQPQLQLQPQPQQLQQQPPQQNAQQQVARNGMDPKRVLSVNGRAYQKISITGRGGSSKVYKAMSAKHEIFAIKRVSFSRADVQAIEGYVNEIILLRKFEGNAHIVQLFDAEINKERGLLHMVMEFGETDLASVLKRSGARPLGMNTVRLYWEQMLRAVQTIHDERVVHADLKPANYLLVKGALKLIDFGIAKAIGNDTTNIHRENQIGTVNYMSPEAIKETNAESGRRMMKLGRASDIWSLGIILYQMCYGRTPFAQLALFRKLASIPDPSFVIPYPPFMAGCLQVGSEGDPNADSSPRLPDGTEKVAVPLDLLRVMRLCLQRDPAKRMSIPDLLVDPLLCPISLDQALPSAMSQMLSLLKRNPQVLDQWDVSDAQNESVLSSLVHALHQREQNR